MPAAVVDLIAPSAQIDAGSWYDVSIPINDVNGDPFVMTSGPFTVDAATAQFRLSEDSPGEPLMELTLISAVDADAGMDGVVISDGFVRLSISPDKSTAVSYDLSLTDEPLDGNRVGVYAVEIESSGVELRIVQGQYEMTPETVRPDPA
jgi:hypothetical protein